MDYTNVFQGRVGWGERPALLVVDFTNAYVTKGSPFYAEGVPPAVAATLPLLKLVRSKNLPVVFTKVKSSGLFVKKVPALANLDSPLADIVPELEPEEILTKQFPSAFFGTPLISMFKNVDTIILVGCSTSGCIRATAIDAISYGFHCIVPKECVGDRHPDVHNSNLFDIDAKSADVMPLDDVLHHLENNF